MKIYVLCFEKLWSPGETCSPKMSSEENSVRHALESAPYLYLSSNGAAIMMGIFLWPWDCWKWPFKRLAILTGARDPIWWISPQIRVCSILSALESKTTAYSSTTSLPVEDLAVILDGDAYDCKVSLLSFPGHYATVLCKTLDLRASKRVKK